MIALNNGLTPDESKKVAKPWSNHSNVIHVDFAAAGVAAASFIERNKGAFLTIGWTAEKVKLVNTLLSLAIYPEQVDQVLTDVGGLQIPEAKAAYLETVTGSVITSRLGGNTEDDFWALAEALVAGHLKILSLDG